MANERLSLFIKPAVSRWLLLAHKKQIDKKGKPMSQVAQTPQKFTLPGMHKRIPPASLEKQREGRVWLHLPALVFMIVLTQIPFLLALWFSLHSWNLLDRKSTRLNSSHLVISYAVFCLKKKK